jgi:2-polyprenyl-3-methyl-5-hydroxy-6-metoxy-1,4-benzoquinol methylase
MTVPPEYAPWKLGSLRRTDGTTTDYRVPYWGVDGKSTIEDQVWNCHGFIGDNGKTKAQTVLDWCVGNKLLEIGCAPGSFLKLAKEAGYECTGLEPCAYHVPFIREYSGCTVANMMFDDFLAGPEFSTIVALDVIEHVNATSIMSTRFCCMRTTLRSG